MAQKKELVQFSVKNNTDCDINVPLLQRNIYSINATTKYSWNIQTIDLSCGTGSIVINGATYPLSYTANSLNSYLSALNALGFGFFCTELIGGVNFLFTQDDTNVYGNINDCATGTTTSTTTTSTTGVPTTSTTTTSTTLPSTSTTTTTTTGVPTTSTTTTTTTIFVPTTSTTTTTTTGTPTTSTTTTSTTLAPTTSTTTTTTTLAPTTSTTTTTTTTGIANLDITNNSLDISISSVTVNGVATTVSGGVLPNTTGNGTNLSTTQVGVYDVVVFYSSSVTGQKITLTGSGGSPTCQGTLTGSNSMTFVGVNVATFSNVLIQAEDGTC